MAAAVPAITAIGTMAGGAASIAQATNQQGPQYNAPQLSGANPAQGLDASPYRLPALSASAPIAAPPQLSVPSASSSVGGQQDLMAILKQLGGGQ